MDKKVLHSTYGISFSLACCLMFIVLTLIAMVFYPGGTYLNHYAEGYSFWNNFFSDLGMVNTFLGGPKLISLTLFVVALTFVGLAFISLSYYMPVLMDRYEKSRIYIKTGSVFGFIAGIGYIGVAFTPWDILLTPHIIFVFVAFISFLLLAGFYTAGIFKNDDYPNIYAYLFLFFSVVLGAYIVLLFIGPAAEEEAGLVLQAAGQKIIVYLAIVIMSVQAYGALMFIKHNFSRV